jgi:hypothetical protein
MASAAPEFVVRRGLDRGLVGTTLASALLHAAAVAVLILLPGRFLSAPPKLESYTVDLVAPDVIGGTNLIPGGGKSKPRRSKRNRHRWRNRRRPNRPRRRLPSLLPNLCRRHRLPPCQSRQPSPRRRWSPPSRRSLRNRPSRRSRYRKRRSRSNRPKPVEAKAPEPKPVVAPKPPAAEVKPPAPAPKPPEPAKPVAKAVEPPKPPVAAKPPVAVNPSAPETQKKAAEPSKAETTAERAAQKTR